MIELRNVSKSYVLNGTRKVVARDLNFTFPSGESVGLLGRNGAGKSSLLRMLAGTMLPDTGEILSSGTISWPVGFSGSFHPELTGAQNVRFVARLYGVDTEGMIAFVRDFAEIGQHFHLPVRSYSSGMRSRLAFGISMAVPFDTYLIDEVTAVGDAAFSAKSNAILRARLEESGAVIVSHSMPLLKKLCRSGAVLHDGQLFYYERIEQAIRHHESMMRGALPRWMRGDLDEGEGEEAGAAAPGPRARARAGAARAGGGRAARPGPASGTSEPRG
ncbi:capsular polysaccharide transport system ATP-binding protein [[Luteovulum] sphaeroides subsp. megalophilum]|uniref:ABC transporter ATP-binding protein n=1 Tax=Cereibacter sphaeroides TaxID=1063 RepID=UPI000B66D789|nr:ABC transporter ATP-binding protein [Cereibacter sphaeroides]SNT37321.1 capsular polysaccharide transport system ATP-binding protein [[Luteovulum] sphaeroides subsp. megalophilum]